jgi:hypothetical protein
MEGLFLRPVADSFEPAAKFIGQGLGVDHSYFLDVAKTLVCVCEVQQTKVIPGKRSTVSATADLDKWHVADALVKDDVTEVRFREFGKSIDDIGKNDGLAGSVLPNEDYRLWISARAQLNRKVEICNRPDVLNQALT